jgi:MmpS family membrane protein
MQFDLRNSGSELLGRPCRRGIESGLRRCADRCRPDDEKGLKEAMFRVVRRAWIPLLLVVVVALGAYAVIRIRDTLGANATATADSGNGADTKPFNPKHIDYEITGSGGSVNLDYLDENGQPHRVDNATLPWSFTIVTTLPSMSANIIAQGDKGVHDLRCRVVVDGQVRDDRNSDEYQPFIYCLVKSV